MAPLKHPNEPVTEEAIPPRIYEGVVHMWCDECNAQYLDVGGPACEQTSPEDWFRDLYGKRVRITIEAL